MFCVIGAFLLPAKKPPSKLPVAYSYIRNFVLNLGNVVTTTSNKLHISDRKSSLEAPHLRSTLRNNRRDSYASILSSIENKPQAVVEKSGAQNMGAREEKKESSNFSTQTVFQTNIPCCLFISSQKKSVCVQLIRKSCRLPSLTSEFLHRSDFFSVH